MANKLKEHPVTFSQGWDTRGSGVGEPLRIVDIKNAWLSREDIGAVESMPSDTTLVTLTGLSNIVTLAGSTNVKGALETDGEWPGVDVQAGTLAIVAVDEDGRIAYYSWPPAGGEGQATLLSTVTQPSTPGSNSIVRLNDTFYVFQGAAAADRRPQKTVVGSSTISEIGLDRPDTTDTEDINISLNSGGDNNVVGPVRYWISKVEQGNESALSEALRRSGDIKNDLYFSGSSDVSWGDVLDKTGGADFTIECMVKVASDNTDSAFIFGKRDKDGNGNGYALELKNSGGARVRLKGASGSFDADTENTIRDGTWYHLAAVYNDTANTLVLYRNGEVQETTASTIPGDMSNALDLTAGEDGGGAENFKGRMSEFRIWSEARTQSEIRALMKESIPDTSVSPDYDNLEGYWPTVYDSAAATTLADEKGSNDGTLSSSAMWGDNESYGEAVINCGDGNRVDVNFTATRFHGDTYNIYRSFRFGAVPFYVAQFEPTGDTPGTTDIYTDDIHDDYLGDPPYVHGDQPQPLGIPAIVHTNRIFLAYNSYLYWSDIANEESFWWEDDTDPDGHNEVGNWITVYPDDGDKITALASDYDSLIIFKANHVYRLYGRTPDEFNLRPVVPSSTNMMSIGCPCQNAVCSTSEGLVFYWNRAVYQMSGGIVKKISEPIEELLNAIDFGGANTNDESVGVSIGHWTSEEKVWLSLPSASSAGTANVTFIYDLDRKMWVGYRDVGYTGAQSLRPGWAGAGRSSFSEEKFISGMGGGASGDALILSVADTPATAPTDSYAEVAPFYGSGLSTQKLFAYVDVIYESSATGSFDFSYKIDDGAYQTAIEIDMTGQTSGRRYRSRVNLREGGRSLQIKFAGDDANTKWKVLGVVYGFQDQVSVSR